MPMPVFSGPGIAAQLIPDIVATVQGQIDATRSQVTPYLTALNNLAATPLVIPPISAGFEVPPAPVVSFTPLPALTPIVQNDIPAPAPVVEAVPEVDLDFGTEPVAPVLPERTVVMPSIGTAPSIPAVDEVALPAAPTLASITPPTLLAISVPTFSGINLHSEWLPTLDNAPELTVVRPTNVMYDVVIGHDTNLQQQLRAALIARISGGTGLTPVIEEAIWARAAEREVRVASQEIDVILRDGEATGFALPPGVVNAMVRAAQRNHFDKLTALSRDIAIEQAKLEQTNVSTSIGQGIELDRSLFDQAFKAEQLNFEAHKLYIESEIQLYNAAVNAFRALVEQWTAYASVYRTLIDAERARVEAYRAQVDAERARAEMNTALVRQYEVQIDASQAQVDLYRAQLAGAEALVQIQKLRIEAAGESVRAYAATVNAATANIEAQKAALLFDETQANIYKTRVDAFATRANLQIESSRAATSLYEARVRARAVDFDGYRARVEAESKRVEALGRVQTSVVETYKVATDRDIAAATSSARIWEAGIRQYEAAISNALNTAKLNTEVLVTQRQLAQDAAKVGAQIYAQFAASSANQLNVNASASAGDSSSYGISHSATYDGGAA